MNVACLIADIVASRNIADRAKLERDLNDRLTEVNTTSKANIISPYTITLGDEFQAVYEDFSSVFRDISDILWAIFPNKIRFSLGRGILTTEINSNAATGMDGPAFYTARNQLTSLKQYGQTIIAISGQELASIKLINKSLLLFSHEFEKWNRTAVGCFVHLLHGKSIGEIEKAVGVKQRAVYKAISSKQIRDYVDYFELLPQAIKESER